MRNLLGEKKPFTFTRLKCARNVNQNKSPIISNVCGFKKVCVRQHKQTDRQRDRQTERQTDRQTDTQTHRQTQRKTDRYIDRETERQKDRETDR